MSTVEMLFGREVRPTTHRSWRRGQGWGDDGLWHFYLDVGTADPLQACWPVHLAAGAVPCEADPLCPECVAVARGEKEPNHGIQD